MALRTLLISVLVGLLAPLASCQRGAAPVAPAEQTLASYPAADLEGVISWGQVAVDAATSADGNGSLRIEASAPTTVELWVADQTEVDAAMLFYRAKLRSEGLEGRAYLEMWAHFPGQGEYFSRGLQSAISGDTEWSPQETPFRLEAGQQPDYVKLNLAIEGTGTVWIDDARLVAVPRS